MENVDVSHSPDTPDKSMISFKYLRNILTKLNDQKNKSADFSIAVGDKKVKIHRIILAAQSKKLRSQVMEMNRNELSLPLTLSDHEFRLFEMMIDSLYCDRVKFHVHNPGDYIRFLVLLDNELLENTFYRYAKRMDFTASQALKIFVCVFSKNYQFASNAKILDRVRFEVLKKFKHFKDTPSAHKSLMEVPLNAFEFLISHKGNGADEEAIIEIINDYIQVNKLNEDVANRLYSNAYKCDSKTIETLKYTTKADYRPGNSWFIMISFLAGSDHKYVYYDVRKKTFTSSKDVVSSHNFNNLNSLLKGKSFISLEIIDGQLGGLHRGKDSDSLPIFQKFENNLWNDCYKTQYHINDFMQSNFRIISVGGRDNNRGSQLIGCAVYGDGPWRMFKALDTRVENHTLCMVSGTVYRFGGQNSESQNSFSSCYSIQLWPTAQVWKELTLMPLRANRAVAVHFDGKIFLFGGFADIPRAEINQSNQVYDIETNSWQTFAKCGEAFNPMCAFELSGIIYLVGMDNFGQTSSSQNNSDGRPRRNSLFDENESEEMDDNGEQSNNDDSENGNRSDNSGANANLIIYSFNPRTQAYKLEAEMEDTHQTKYVYSLAFSQYDLDNIALN